MERGCFIIAIRLGAATKACIAVCIVFFLNKYQYYEQKYGAYEREHRFSYIAKLRSGERGSLSDPGPRGSHKGALNNSRHGISQNTVCNTTWDLS